MLRMLARLPSSDLTYSWFASVYASILVLSARLLGIPSIVTLGGADVANEKELDYGIWISWWKARLVRYGIRHASAVLAVDESLRREAMKLADYDGKNLSVLPTGYDPEFWSPQGNKKTSVLTVASCPDAQRARLKGIDFFFQLARKFPEVPFIAVGIEPSVSDLLSPPENARCIPFSDRIAVREFYRAAKVYCQLSLREGLPNALCEAMLCECVPVGTKVGGIPTAIGDVGYLVEKRDIEKASQVLGQALEADSGHAARERILTHLTLQKREEALERIIRDLLR